MRQTRHRVCTVTVRGPTVRWAPLVAAVAVAVALVPGPATAAAECTGTAPCLLSAGLPAGGDVQGSWLTPDGLRAVFYYDLAGIDELYSVPIRGGTPVKLNVPVQGSPVTFVAISPDSARVLYRAVAQPGQPAALFSVPAAGPASASIRLADIAPLSSAVRISPDSRKVVFPPNGRTALRAVPIEGPANAGARLTDPLVPGGQIGLFEISANSASVVYTADQNTDAVNELYRVPLTLTPAPDPPTTKLNGPLPAGGRVQAFELSPDSGPVVYLANQDSATVPELFSVRLGGAGRVKLNPPLPPDFFVSANTGGPDLVRFARTPTGFRVIYLTEQDVLNGVNPRQLNSVPVAGPATASVRLDRLPEAGTNLLEFQASATGRVVYTMARPATTSPARFWLMSVAPEGPASASVAVSFPSESSDRFVLSPDGTRVVWQLGNQLFAIPVAGGTHVAINGPEVPSVPVLIGGNVSRVLYRATGNTGPELFSAPLNGVGNRFNLTSSLDLIGFDTGSIALTRAGDVLYSVLHPNGRHHLYSSRLVPPA